MPIDLEKKGIQKRCNKCLIIKPLELFHKNKWHKADGRKSICKRCEYLNNKRYEALNRKKVNEIHKRWADKNRPKVRKRQRINQSERRKKFPWEQHYYMAKMRCENPARDDYKHYGGKGIKLNITLLEVKKLWLRDKANQLFRPSIDRIEASGNYTLENCRFIEHSENARRAAIQRWS